jgi:hypothetical protein
MREILYEVRHDGAIPPVDVHDGVIDSFRLTGSTVSLEIAKPGARTEFLGLGLHDMMVSGFIKRPIVSEVLVWPIASAPISANDASFGFTHLRCGAGRSALYRDRLIREQPGLKLLHILCSDGGPFTFLCDEVGIRSL